MLLRATGFLLALCLLGSIVVLAQPTAPANVNGCIYNAVLPTLTSGQSRVFQCDASAKLIVTVN
jgi:hypothetical protein